MFLATAFLSFFLVSLATSSKTLRLEIFQLLLPNQEIVVVDDRNGDDLVGDIPEIAQRFLTSASLGNLAFQNRLLSSIAQSNKNVAIVLDLTSEKGIFETLSQIGNALAALPTIHRIWAVVLWPETMKSVEEVNALQDNPDFTRAMTAFRLDSLLYFAFNTSSNGTLIYEGYRAGDHIIFHEIHNGTMYLNCQYCEGLALRRFNFHHRSLRVTAVNDSELNDDIHVYEDPNGTISYSENGFSGEMHIILKQLLNFTTEPTLSKGFGSLNNATNRWEGSIGDVAYGKADIGMSITIFQPDRAQVVSFLPPADEHLISAFFTPSDVQPIRDIFAQPFKPLLWAAVITTWLTLACCMILFSMIRQHYGIGQEGNPDSSDESSEGGEVEDTEPDFRHDSFIWALGTACQQGWDEHPKASSLRTIFISGSLTGVVAYAGYSAAIVSTLSTHKEPIQSPEQLLSSNLHVGIRKGFISNLLEQKNARDTMSHFLEKIEQSKKHTRYLNVTVGLDELLKNNYAFISTRDTMYDRLKMTTDEKLICGIRDLPILKYGFPIGYPVPKFSQYREILRYALTMIREPGILYRLRYIYSFKRRCLEAGGTAGNALGPNDVFTAFMILVAGVVLSVGIMLLERTLAVNKVVVFVQ